MKLEEIEKLCDEATPGPWAIADDDSDYFIHVAETGQTIAGFCCHGGFRRDEDGKFVAASRTLLPKLLEIAKAANEVIEFKWIYHEDTLPALAKALKELEKSNEK